MKKGLLVSILSFFFMNGIAQKTTIPFRKLSYEPAIGTRLSTAFGLADIQASCMVQKQVNRRFSLVSHTAFSHDINCLEAFKNVNIKISLTTFQKLGLGTSVYAKNSSHTLVLMAGAKYFVYSANLKNPKLEDNVQSKFNTFSFDKGLLYNLKIGHGKTYFSGRIYAPVFDEKWMMIENTVIEMGVGFNVK